MRAAASVLVLAAVAGCGAAAKPPSLELARLEAARDPAPFTGRRDAGALHALGRIGGPEAVAELRHALASTDPAVVIAAAEGLWFADDPAAAPEVARLVDDPRPAVRLAAVRVLGRLGTAAEEGAIVRALADADLRVRAGAGIAAGILGRRKVATDATLAPLVENARHADANVRHGAAYGLSFHPGIAGAWEELSRLGNDPMTDTRILAYGGLARSGTGGVEKLAHGLADASPWVRVEAARALSAPKSTPEAHAKLATWLDKRAEEHAVLEGLTRLAAFAKEDAVRGLFDSLHNRGGPGPVACLAAAGLARAGESLAVLEECAWERARLIAEAVKEGGGLPSERLPAVLALAASTDTKSRAAAADVAPSLLPDPEAEKLVLASLDAREPAVAGSAAEALGALGDKAPTWVIPTLIERAKVERPRDPELFLSFLGALVTLKANAALPLAAAAVGDGNPAVRASARAAYKELAGEEAQEATPERPVPPPVDLGAIAGGRPVLEVTTNKGTFTVELDTALAPWNTGALVTLTRKGFYDGVVWHRVVPGFVVQGGDPTGTGWGGPGFNLPAEMSNAPYARGTVGIADAGRDTGGSQWFIMHAPAPHLDGRYTVVGHVSEGDMAVVDKLIVGDRMIKVRVK